MILRHSTHISNLASIIKSGRLSSKFNEGKKDEDYLSFEFNPPTDFLRNNFHLVKNKELLRLGETRLEWKKDDTFTLDFDFRLIQQSGIKIFDNINGRRFSEYQDIIFGLRDHVDSISWPPKSGIQHLHEVSEENVYELVGKYQFIYECLSLDYLNEESKNAIKSLVKI
ncbi:hypothetical protein [Exiguobacterium sp. s195]|uniref:hypothetical protein n=1 Tax=Exiguobacterium sp. s195 TaxID=2751282 RepID=UPI001BEABCE9|nr:hypothetical protein [Exiguobacterium sp. s195]